MNWTAFGAVGEVVGALAVLITLVYLARQIRQSSVAVRAQSYESFVNGLNNVNLLVASRPEMADLLVRGHYEPDSLSDTEGVQYFFLVGAYFNQWEQIFRLYDAGVLTPQEWQLHATAAAHVMSTAGGRIFRSQTPVLAHLFTELDKYATDTPVLNERMGGRGGTIPSPRDDTTGAAEYDTP